MSLKNFLKPIVMTSTDAAQFDGTYKVLTPHLSKPCSYLQIVNNSNRDVTVSFDGGASDHFFVPSGMFFPVLAQMSSMPNTSISLIAKGTAISVKGAAGAGSVYLSGLYQPSDNI